VRDMVGQSSREGEAGLPMTPAAARLEFAACQSLAYLDVAARAPMPRRVALEIAEYVEVCRAEGARKPEWFERVEAVRARFAHFIGAAQNEVAFLKNTSDGINTFAHGLQLKPGDNVIVCPEIEHPNNVYPWLHLRERGVEIKLVPSEQGSLSPSALVESIDSRTRIASVSSVAFVNGTRADVRSLSEICTSRGVFLLVDAVQELGIAPVDVRATGVDGMVAATQKGLLGLYGLGTLYCSPRWLASVTPTYLSRTAIVSNRHESEMVGLDSYTTYPDARKFEIGNPNFIGIFALDASLSLLSEVGQPTTWKHVSHLASTLIEGLLNRGIAVETPGPERLRAGIVAFAMPEAKRIVSELAEQGVRLSLRKDLIRASLHVYNNEDDVSRLLGLLDELA
jgi:cysteine desulfurase/selenocysteine lyase